mmetsp:Transcript_10063/g.23285  ORF Transcript_10063/g.23285 Transcript_10063/m.23285 type:complete len:364 (+) Transcript_10063:238-1329(+)
MSASQKATMKQTTASLTGSKRPLMTTARDGTQLSEKKLRRLEKNRLSARECRRRKREATENLERQINLLEGENLRLRLQLQIGEEAEESLGKEQEKVMDEIDKLLKSGASEAEIYATIETFKEKFADYGKDRRSALEFHLRSVERLLMPTQTTSTVMRALQGGDSTSDAGSETSESVNTTTTTTTSETPDAVNADGQTSAAEIENNQSAAGPSAAAPQPPGVAAPTDGGAPPSSAPSGDGVTSILDPKTLFKHLVTHLGVTPEQAAALKDSRWVARDLDDALKESLSVLSELRTRLTQIGDGLDSEFRNVRSILTPTQAAKFLVWVANNSACMHMLNELWERKYQPPTADSGDDSSKSSEKGA